MGNNKKIKRLKGWSKQFDHMKVRQDGGKQKRTSK